MIIHWESSDIVSGKYIALNDNRMSYSSLFQILEQKDNKVDAKFSLYFIVNCRTGLCSPPVETTKELADFLNEPGRGFIPITFREVVRIFNEISDKM